MAELKDLKKGAEIEGIVPGRTVTIVDVTWHGSEALTVYYKQDDGATGNEILFSDVQSRLKIIEKGRAWSFEADGDLFRLVSEAYRIRLAHLFDPYLAVHTSPIDPLPHQITAVYGEMLPRQPLRFLLADDPGAGKTIMTGLLLKELMIRGDLKRCLICCPGSLTEQWQDELYQKFQLDFDLITRESIEGARSGNVFLERDLVICRLDQLSRSEEIQDKLKVAEWDVVVCDEAHKMSASYFGNEVKYTKRYRLGQLLSEHARHFLLLTATPHNGKPEDFQLFMALLDGDRFEGKPRDGSHAIDVEDLMRRMVKEELVRFDGRPLFPERYAYTVTYRLSPLEQRLYREVTDYVREEMNRADRLADTDKKRGNTVGFALQVLQRRLASSPEAIYQSLARRRRRLERRLAEEQLRERARDVPLPLDDDESIDDLYDELPDEELERLEEEVVDRASAAQTIQEFKLEIQTLERLEKLADEVRRSGLDRKWEELRELLQGAGEHQAGGEIFDEHGNRRKLIIFTEHRDTLDYLARRIRALLGREETVVIIHGGVGREERKKAQERFTQDKDVIILLATDAAGEGINLQRAHLMVNYDLPWNPNRIEQRFGRVHRIGQTEVCHLWNLVAGDTREGDVFERLLSKLEQQREALGGSVFDVLGKSFSERSLREMLIEAIRYGEREDVRARLFEQIDRTLDVEHLRALIEERALAHDALPPTRVEEIRRQMERAEARRMQPHFISSFFREAFQHLGGSMHERESGRYEITRVPIDIRTRDRVIGFGAPVVKRYERATFEKSLIAVPGLPGATLLAPGHPLLDATIDLILERYRDLLKKGAVLVDPEDPGTGIRILSYLEHSIQDGRADPDGRRRVVSRRMQFVELSENGETRTSDLAPYLDYRPTTDEERRLAAADLSKHWLTEDLDDRFTDHAIRYLVRPHFDEVQQFRAQLVNKTAGAVKERLTREIRYWDHRANELKAQELAGKRNAKLNSAQARQRADELEARLKKRMEELAQERQLSPLPPVVIGGAVIVPQGLLDGRQPDAPAEPANEPARRKLIDELAIQAVLVAERAFGRDPREMPHSNPGYDIESVDPSTGRTLFIEVKGKAKGSPTVTISKTQILTGLNKPDDFILAIVEVDGEEAAAPWYVERPFINQPDFAVTSVNYDLGELLALASTQAS
ncbi:MAG: DUF3883 domain-containing protein [Actinobacteria bacterium]|nr:DUF3883 domain-containing protein [Actinomycetota bacterium]